MKPQIGYVWDPGAQMELIVCRQSEMSYPPHNHVSVFTLGMVLEGRVKASIGGGARIYSPGEVFLIPPYVLHSIQSQGPCSLLSLCVGKDRAAEDSPCGLKGDGLELLRAHVPELERGWGGLMALLDCLPVLARALPTGEDSPVGRLRQALERHPEDRLSVDEMAASAFTSKYELIRAFKREVGLTPHQFQIQNRVRKAQRRLAQRDSVAQAAADAGFFDQSHLVRQFKRIVGLTPAGYRAACGTLPPVTPGRG